MSKGALEAEPQTTVRTALIDLLNLDEVDMSCFAVGGHQLRHVDPPSTLAVLALMCENEDDHREGDGDGQPHKSQDDARQGESTTAFPSA